MLSNNRRFKSLMIPKFFPELMGINLNNIYFEIEDYFVYNITVYADDFKGYFLHSKNYKRNADHHLIWEDGELLYKYTRTHHIKSEDYYKFVEELKKQGIELTLDK